MSLASPLGVLGGGGQGGGGPATNVVLIQRQVLAAPAQTVTFSAIPATSENLLLIVMARSDKMAVIDTVDLRFNADAGAHYYGTEFYTSGGANQPTAVNNTADNAMSVGGVVAASSALNAPGILHIFIPAYARAVMAKAVQSLEGAYWEALGGLVGEINGFWNQTNAVTSITLFVGGNFITGSVFSLYGLP